MPAKVLDYRLPTTLPLLSYSRFFAMRSNTLLPLEYYRELENRIVSVPSTVQSNDGPYGDLLYLCYSFML